MEGFLELVEGAKHQVSKFNVDALDAVEPMSYEAVSLTETDELLENGEKSLDSIKEGSNLSQRSSHNSIIEEAKKYTSIMLPSVLVSLMWYLQWTISAIYAGNVLGVEALGGLSLANLSGNILGKSLIFGMLSAYDTLAPQAYGSKDYQEVGYLTQRSIVIGLVLCAITALVWWNIGPLLDALGQPREAVILASSFLKIAVLYLPSDLVAELCKRFLAVQNIVYPFVVIQSVTVGFHYLYLRGFVLLWGFKGLAFAHVASSYTSMALALLYVKLLRPHRIETLPPLNLREALRSSQVMDYLRLGIPGMFSMAEWWYWEIICIIAGKLGPVELEAHSIAYNLIPLAFMIPLGIQIATIIRTGTLLAEGNVKMAQKVALVSTFLSFFVGFAHALLLFLLRDPIIRSFTTDTETILICIEIWNWVSAFLVVDAILGVVQGILRGLGRQFILSVTLTACLWIIGLPFTYFLVFTLDGGLLSLWKSMVGPYILLDTVVLVVIYMQNFGQISKDIQEKHKHANVVDSQS